MIQYIDTVPYPPFDCDCSSKTCVALNTIAAPTPIPQPTPGACQAQLTAAIAVFPNLMQTQGYLITGGIATDITWNEEIGPALGSFPNTTVQSKLLAVVCCLSCVAGNPSFEAVSGGWVGDCNTFALTPVASSCTKTGGLALLNCFKSGAPQVTMSFAAVMGVLFAALM